MTANGSTTYELDVRDVERSLRFYRKAFGAKVTWRGEGMVQVETPGRPMLATLNRVAALRILEAGFALDPRFAEKPLEVNATQTAMMVLAPRVSSDA